MLWRFAEAGRLELAVLPLNLMAVAALAGSLTFGLTKITKVLIKAVLLLGGATLLVIMTLAHFGMNPVALFEQAAAQYSDKVLSPAIKQFIALLKVPA